MPKLSRRALLTAAAGSMLAGCASPLRLAAAPPAATPPAAASAVATPQPPAGVVGREAVVARYRSAVPEAWGPAVSGVMTRLPTTDRCIALTFDACGGPHGSGYDKELMDLLRRNAIPATLFLNARWIAANPQLTTELDTDPLFEIGNHGTRHQPLSVTGRSAYGIAGTRDVGEVYDEVAGNHAELTALLGHPPRFFRSGTAHYDDVAVRVVAELGERAVGFDVNGDQGATLSAAHVERAVLGATAGSVVIGHMNHPGSGTANGMAAALPALAAAGFRFVRLGDVVG